MVRINVNLEIQGDMSLPSGEGYTPQSIALVSQGERYVFCSGSDHSITKKRNVLRCSATSYTDLGAKVATGRSKGATYCPLDNCLYVTGYDGTEGVGLVKKINLKKNWTASTLTFSHPITGITFDKSTGQFYMSGDDKVYVYASDDLVKLGGTIGKSRILKKFVKQFNDDGRIEQDICSIDGYVLCCKSTTENGIHQTSYLDCYNTTSGEYIKSFKIDNNAELEGADFDADGYLHLVFAQDRKVCRSQTPIDPKKIFTEESSGYGGALAINDAAIKLAWPGNTNNATYSFDGGKPTDAFKEAFDKAYPGHSNWSNWQGKNGPAKGASCDVFAGVVLKESGYIPDAPRGLSSQLKDFPISNKFQVTKYNGAPTDKNSVKPGDIVMYTRPNGNGHIMIICQEKGKTVIAEASVNATYGHINTSLSKITSSSNKDCTYVCRPTGEVTDSTTNTILGKQYIEGFSYGGGIKQLYSSSNYDYIYDWDTHDLQQRLRTDVIEHHYDELKNSDSYTEVIAKGANYLPDEIVKASTENIKIKAETKKATIYKGWKESNNLLSADSVVQAPIVVVDFNGTKIGGVGNTGDAYPNYLNSVTANRVNGRINNYTISLTYQVRPNEDSNFIDKLLSTCGYTNPIKIEYGDANSPNATYREESALITKVSYDEDVSSSTINYTISAVSSIAVSSANIKNYPSRGTKPSTAIYDLLYNSGQVSTYLQDLFPGMRNRDIVSSNTLIPTNDAAIKLNAQTDMDPVSYLAFLVSCMNNESGETSSYFLSFYDDVNNKYGGPYFKITEVNRKIAGADSVLSTTNFYEVDIGYPTDNMITKFSISTNNYWGLVYEYNDKIPSYRYGIDDNGTLYYTKHNRLLSDNAYLTESLIDSNWWRDVTEFPISAKLTLKGVIRPVMLMSYIRVNAQFYGQRDLASGIYVVTEQIDTVSKNGFFTELTLLRVAEDNPGLTKGD